MANEAEARLEEARREFVTVLSQHELDRHGNDGIGLATWACSYCFDALDTFKAAAQAAVQTRVEALEAALTLAHDQLNIDLSWLTPDANFLIVREEIYETQRKIATLTATEQGAD